MSADEPPAIEALRKRLGLTFPILSDPKLALAKTYGVREKGRTNAIPSTFVIGADGKIRFAHVAPNPVDRLSTAALLTALRAN